jgi:hypothetical protein
LETLELFDPSSRLGPVRVSRALVGAVTALTLAFVLLPGFAAAQPHVNGCQLRANAEGRAVTCLVPGVDWNPKTWESC